MILLIIVTLIYLAIGIDCANDTFERKDRWGNKTDALLSLIIVLLWPVVYGGVLFGLLAALCLYVLLYPVAGLIAGLMKWSDLPDDKNK